MVEADADFLMKSLTYTLQATLKYGDEDDKDLEVFKKLAQDICRVEWTHIQKTDKITEASRQNTVEEFDAIVNDEDRSTFNARNSQRYKLFVKQAQQQFENASSHTEQEGSSTAVEDDDVVMSQTAPNIDPLTKEPLVDPVRNLQCGHIYGKRSITNFIKSRPKPKCPVIGCPNKHLKLEHLVEVSDIELGEGSQQSRS